MSNYIEKKLKEFRDEIYGENDALFDRKGNNVSQQVENFILQVRTDTINEIKKELEFEGYEKGKTEGEQMLSVEDIKRCINGLNI